MTAATIAPAPVRDALAWILDDAIQYRSPDREGCCEGHDACGSHAFDRAVAGAMGALLAEVESAQGDHEAIAALLAHCTLVLAETAAYDDADGGARDDG